jgi:hypothetical protein
LKMVLKFVLRTYIKTSKIVVISENKKKGRKLIRMSL